VRLDDDKSLVLLCFSNEDLERKYLTFLDLTLRSRWWIAMT
jgi:hypothetical protein